MFSGHRSLISINQTLVRAHDTNTIRWANKFDDALQLKWHSLYSSGTTTFTFRSLAGLCLRF